MFTKKNKAALKSIAFVLGIFCLQPVAMASDAQWGLGVSFRHGTIPYDTDKADTVRTTMPRIYYEDDLLFMRGDVFGAKTFSDDDMSINVIGRRRFVNIPRSMQNQYQEDTIDFGLQMIMPAAENQSWRFELLTEGSSKSQLYGGYDWQLQYGDLELNVDAGLRYKNKKFNSHYYGLKSYGGESISSGIEGQLGANFRYPLLSGLYLTGRLEWIELDSNARKGSAVDSSRHGSITLGVTYFNDGKSSIAPVLQEGSYLRFSHGWATPSDMNQILQGKFESDPYNNQLSSVFYGHPLKNNWLGQPIDVYLTGGLAYHYDSRVQDRAVEGVVALKAYYNFTWPVRWRIGFAQGASYISKVSYIEKQEMDSKENKPSNLMNYLDTSVDVNLGDVFKSPALKTAWLGWSMHHRSSIFKMASQFGRIKGGSNYNTIYLQWHY